MLLHALAVASGRRIGEVVAHGGQPVARLVEAPGGDAVGDEADVVGVVAGAGAEAALPFGFCEILVGQRGRIDAILADVEHAGPQRQRRPVTVGIVELGREPLRKRRRGDRLRDAHVLGGDEVADIDGEDDIDRREFALGRDALEQAIAGVEHVGLDAGLGGELVEQRLDQPGLAIASRC